MIAQKQQEQIIRKVSAVGNGAHIFAPKEWIDEKVLLIRVPKLSLKEEIIKMLEPHLANIAGVYLYGSYARGEQEKDSDIDILIISNKEFKINKKDFDVRIVDIARLDNSIKKSPLLFYSIINEAKPIINSSLLEELKRKEINLSYFKEFIESSKRIIKINKGFIDLDKEESDYVESTSVIYSLILRLRGVFLVKQIIKRKKYSNKLFRKWLMKNVKINYEEIYKDYRAIRDNKETKSRIKIKQAEELLSLLKKEIIRLEKRMKNGKERKKIRKRD